MKSFFGVIASYLIAALAATLAMATLFTLMIVVGLIIDGHEVLSELTFISWVWSVLAAVIAVINLIYGILCVLVLRSLACDGYLSAAASGLAASPIISFIFRFPVEWSTLLAVAMVGSLSATLILMTLNALERFQRSRLRARRSQRFFMRDIRCEH